MTSAWKCRAIGELAVAVGTEELVVSWSESSQRSARRVEDAIPLWEDEVGEKETGATPFLD